MVKVSQARSGRIQSVSRALAILDAVAECRYAPRAQEIADRLGLHLTTAVHLLNTLVDGGYLEKHGRTYTLSTSKVLRLHSRVKTDIRPSPQAVAALHQMTDETGETGYVSCWTGDDVVLALAVEGSHAVRVAVLHAGTRGDLHARAASKCLLAFGPESWLDHYLATHPLRARTPHTIVDADQLRAEVRNVREQGYAEDREEYTEGVCGVSAPLREGGDWPTTALTLIAPAHRYEENKPYLLEVLLRATG
jgi:DNA-binding IclR family transcriptional regulator